MSPTASQLWIGALEDATGFSDELRGFLRALEDAGQAPAARNVPGAPARTRLPERDRRLLARQARRTPASPVVAVHEYVPWPGQPVLGEGGVNVARAMFETDRLPERRLPLLLDRDEIWVPGAFNVETFERGGIPRERLHVLGGTLDFDLFSPGSVEPASLPAPDDHFTFLTNFAFSERKAWRHLLRGWALAFGPGDGVCLVLKVHTEGRVLDVRARVHAFLREEFGPGALERLAPVRIMSDVLAAEEMPRLYAAADAYVLPTRGEGWGRPYMEALAMGLPTIASRWSGQLEFLHDGNAWLVDGEVVAVEHGQEVFLDPCHGHRWFEPDAESLAAQLRAVAGDPAAARARAAAARPELLERFGPAAIAARVAELVDGAAERHAERRARPVTCAIRGPFGSVSSLAVVNDALADGLEARGHNLWRHAPGFPRAGNDHPTISHSWPPDFDPPGTGPSVLVLPWEYGAPPADWVDNVHRKADRVWVPSDYVRRGYVEAGMPDGVVEVVPNGVDTTHFTPDGPARAAAPDAGCTFLFVGGTVWRKGVDLLLAAWADAFGPEDDVALVLKDFGTQTHYRGQSVIADPARLAADPALAPIVHLTDEVPYRDLPALYRGADALVVPYRAEGFCLPALEAMACGVPVIHNGAGPTAEFVPDDAGWALPARRAPLPETGLPPLAGEGWVHEVDHDELVAALREAAADAAGRAARGRRAAQAAQRHTWEVAVDRAERALARLDDEDLPVVRFLGSGVVDSRGATVLFAPDWEADAWMAALEHWTAAVSGDDPVTLALYAGEVDTDALVPRVMAAIEACGRPEEELPDLVLCLPSDHRLEHLVLGADAVLVDDPAADRLPVFVRRRARRLLHARPDALAAWVAEQQADGTVPAAAPVASAA